MESHNLSVFVFYTNVNIIWISSELTKLSMTEVGVSFGPHVETTKLSDMSKRTVNNFEMPGAIFPKFALNLVHIDLFRNRNIWIGRNRK